ncbi:MAG: sulfide-dependent adenosine diphosphate thiazole synthase [Desulfurococcaceae archaeon]|jgi:thiamine thiazole synthase|nr:sulfide-dependent adenosine diphosphate thiazole synthase [Desulfurococcaceae archaeon]
MIKESHISKVIIRYALKDLDELSEVDVVIVGAGPSGLTASYYLAKEGFKVLVFERRFSFGGGTGPGGNLLPRIVFQEEARPILDDFGIKYVKTEYGLYVADPAEAVAKLSSRAIDAGVRILLGAHVEDLVYRTNPLRITGVMWVWTPIHEGGFHVDPLYTESRAVVDATGHGAEIVNIAARKIPELKIEVKGEKSGYAELAEKLVVEYTGKVIPGLYVTGMAVGNVYGLPRMGPIFGGMLLSGRKVAEIITRDLKQSY